VYSTHESRRWLRRHRRLVLVGIAAALVVGVPAAWATFNDVPPTNPFYDDINAIQGAGITQGCGGGNFCPEDNITRQAEAAFVHRAAGRVAQSVAILDDTIELSGGFATDTRISQVSITVGGVSGQTQFVKLDAHMLNFYNSGSPPFAVWYYWSVGTVCTNPFSAFGISTIASNPGFVESSNSIATGVPTNTVQTFSFCGFTDTPSIAAVDQLVLDATTYPFVAPGPGGSTLGLASEATAPKHPPLR
jgi:S-layer homology domain